MKPRFLVKISHRRHTIERVRTTRIHARREGIMSVWLTTHEAAEFLGISVGMVYKLGKAIPRYRPTGSRGRLKYRKDDLEAYLARRAEGPRILSPPPPKAAPRFVSKYDHGF